MSPSANLAIPPKPKGTTSQQSIVNRTPHVGRSSRESAHTQKMMRPNQSHGEVQGVRQGSAARKNSAQRL